MADFTPGQVYGIIMLVFIIIAVFIFVLVDRDYFESVEQDPDGTIWIDVKDTVYSDQSFVRYIYYGERDVEQDSFREGRKEGFQKGISMCDQYDLDTESHRLYVNDEIDESMFCYLNYQIEDIDDYAKSQGYDVNYVFGLSGYQEYYIITKRIGYHE